MESAKGLMTTEFWFGVLVVLCATVLLVLNDIDQDTWKWAVTTVGGAYILGRSLVKRETVSSEAKVAGFKADLAMLEASPSPAEEAVAEQVAESGDQIREALQQNAEALAGLRTELAAKAPAARKRPAARS